MSRKTRKLMWSVPLIAAVAVIGTLALFLTLTPNGASAQTEVEIPPAAPMNLMAAAYSEGIPQEEIQLTWEAPSPNDGGSPRWYRVDISTNGGFAWTALESSVRNTSYTHPREGSLMASQTFHYRVFAVNQHGISPVSNVASADTDDSWVPERPINLVVTVGVDSSDTDFTADTTTELTINLEWDEPDDPPGAPVTGYVVEYSVDGDVWDPVDDVEEPGDDDETLEAGVTYHYRVAAVNSVGQSRWSSTATAVTLRGAVPDPPTDMRFTVGPEELDVELFWAPPDDPLGDAVTHYEVQGRPVVTEGPMLLGGLPARMSLLTTVGDGPDTADDTVDGDIDDDDNLGNIQVAGIHFTEIDLARGDGSDGEPAGFDDGDLDETVDVDFELIATRLQAAIGDDDLPTTPWSDSLPVDGYPHPTTVTRSEGDDVTVYYSTRKAGINEANNAIDDDGTDIPNPNYWSRHDVSGLDFSAIAIMVEYTGLRFKLTIPGATGADPQGKLDFPSSVTSGDSPDVAKLLGWTENEGATSHAEYRCCPVQGVVDDDDTDDVDETVAPMSGWQIIKTDISRPSGTEIHQFLITERDIDANTTYDARYYRNAEWEFRVRALNRRAPARVEDVGLEDPNNENSDMIPLLGSDWSTTVMATPGSDTALIGPSNLMVTRSSEDNAGRTGLLLRWTKAATARDADQNTVDAAGYRIEYSDTGLQEEGYDWKELVAVWVFDDPSENRQEFIDNHEILGSSDTLAAGQTRHYRIFGLTDVGADPANPEVGSNNEMGWSGEQESGTTAAPTRPDPPGRLRVVNLGRTHITLEWDSPDAFNDNLDGSEEGPSVITHYIVQMSDDAGSNWADVQDDDGNTLKVTATAYTDETLMPAQTRDYRVLAVNSSQQSTWSDTVDATTIQAVLPNEPGGLVAQTGDTAGNVKICWNSQAEQPEDAPVFEYLIQHSADGETGWMDLATVTDITDEQVHTIYTDTMLDAEETRHYRVFAINLRGQSDQSDVAEATASDAAVAPPSTELTMPTMVEATGGVRALTVIWEDGDNALGHLVLLLDSDFELVMTETAPTGKSHTFSPLASGQYTAVVVSYKSVSDYKYDHATVTVN